MSLTPDDFELLARRFGQGFSAVPEVLEAHATDASGLRFVPEAVVLARDAREVSDLVRLAGERGFPVTPRGAGTGLAGGALPVRGGVVLSLAAMDRIRRISPEDMSAEVEPGVVTLTLRQEVEKRGLFYPPDPAGMDKSTMGGNAATNAGGPSCLKYGVTRDYLLGLEAVLGDGEIVRTGALTRKCVAGLDLTRLLAGSEGTLAVITGLTVKLIPRPPAAAVLAALFPDPEAAMRAVVGLLCAGLFPCALEFMDRACLGLVEDLVPFPAPGDRAALLLVECDGSADQVAADRDRAAGLAREFGAVAVRAAGSGGERAALWAMRRQISLRIHERSRVYLPEDVAVPLSRIPDLAEALTGLEKAYGLEIFGFGHAGDGNIHVNITSREEAARGRAEACAADLVNRVLAMGGTISGEHGVGLVKKAFLPLELSARNIRLQQGIKGLFDPRGLLNPGKVLPDRETPPA